MNYFKKLPLPGKLFLLVLFPMLLIIFLTIRVYKDNNERVEMLRGYVAHLNLYANLSAAATQIQFENRQSFLYVLNRDSSRYTGLLRTRHVTDSLLELLDTDESLIVKNYRKYTFLDSIGKTRNRIDSSASVDYVTHYYISVIFRIKTLAQNVAVNNRLLDKVYEELTSAHILNEMFMYLGIIRVNFYSALNDKKNNIPMLYGLLGSYEMYKSYQQELNEKATPRIKTLISHWKNSPDAWKTLQYIDHVFERFSFDSLYDANDWWKASGNSIDQLSSIQQAVVRDARSEMEESYGNEIRRRDTSLLLMIISMVGVLGFMFYTSRVINGMLNELDEAAQRIAVGEEASRLNDKPKDVIGRLANSIEKIDSNNKILTQAATQIGKGDFSVDIRPRGDRDALGIAIVEMKNDLEEYIREIREHERRKDDFIIMASHELKTPITSIKGYVQLLLALFREFERTRQLPSEEAVRSSLNTVEKQINKLTRLLSDLLDLSRIERGKLELEKKRFNLAELVKETIDEVSHTATGRHIIFKDGFDVEVIGDRDRIGQVMVNLLSNALKYSQAPHPVIVDMHTENGHVTVNISDEGIGISEPDQQKIFDRFYRVEGKSEQTYPGFGIGLYIASEIVNRHGGKLTVKSKKGEGSIFGFTIEKL